MVQKPFWVCVKFWAWELALSAVLSAVTFGWFGRAAFIVAWVMYLIVLIMIAGSHRGVQ